MNVRAKQREDTKDRIVTAAIEAFSECGFSGASTRDIANRADANQGLVTYHFNSKEELWKAAADQIFNKMRQTLAAAMAGLSTDDPRERARENIRLYVRFAAAHPELLRFMVEEGKTDSTRMQWLVDRHLKPAFEGVKRAAPAIVDESLLPNLYYVIAGAGSLIFANAIECKRLTGLDPRKRPAVETHADFVAQLLVP
jgi:AcrR family transcriptional regulator